MGDREVERVLSLSPNSVPSRCPETCPSGHTSSVRDPSQGGLLCCTSHSGFHKAYLHLKRSSLGLPGGLEVKILPACKCRQGTRAQFRLQEDPIFCRAAKPETLTTKCPSLCSATREAPAMRSPCPTAGKQPLLSTTRESLGAATEIQHSQ